MVISPKNGGLKERLMLLYQHPNSRQDARLTGDQPVSYFQCFLE
ncbi:hypothetical protein [Rhodopirellula sp. SWK7]|nr:hypothetical protein [Rhodopirellula sp. SWK7]EMI42700.1 hypothetical protein RRSWK_04889 [Rhodopirellula sp. SWK7]